MDLRQVPNQHHHQTKFFPSNARLQIEIEGNKMKLTSQYETDKIFWRTFNAGDTVYIFGNKEGFLSNGTSVEYNHPSGFFQIEIKRGNLFGHHLVDAGRVYSNEDELIITSEGKLFKAEEAVKIDIDPQFKFEFCGTLTQFFDLLNSTEGQDRKVSSSIIQEINTDREGNATTTTQTTSEVSGGGGVKVTGEPTVGGVKTDLEVNANISSKVSNEIKKEISKRFGVEIKTQTSYSEEDTFHFSPKLITALTWSWQRRYITGTANLGSVEFSFDATLGYFSEYIVIPNTTKMIY